MEQELLEVYEKGSNFAVIKLRERKYPGVLIQGDSLSGILGELQEAVRHFDDDREESLGCLENALQQVKWRLDAYHKVCKAHNIT
jgi:hypothetical protein